MRMVQAPEVYEKSNTEIACFLAGGCGNTEWSERCINKLNQYTLNHLVLYNPYNPNIKDPKEQIEWEFNYLNKYINDKFIFSIYFDKYTDQPISMYELGRASVLCKEQVIKIGPPNDSMNNLSTLHHLNWGFPMVVSLNEQAPKKMDIGIQLDLVHIPYCVRTPEEHAEAIVFKYGILRKQMC